MASRLNLSGGQLANLLRVAGAYAGRITNVNDANVTAAAGRVGSDNESEATATATVMAGAPLTSRAGGVTARATSGAGGVMVRATSGAGGA